MKTYVTKIKNIISLLRLIKVKWKPPKHSKILIFDSSGHEYFMEYLCLWEPEILHTRREQVNIFILLLSLLQKGVLKNCYVDRYIKQVNPLLIVTFIDNNPSFYKISLRHSGIKTLFIQNGVRSYYTDVFEILDKEPKKEKKQFHVDYMLTMGPAISEEYGRYISGEKIPIGSLKSNGIKKEEVKKTEILSFISQWYEGGFYIGDLFFTHEAFSKTVDFLIVTFLANYAKKNNKRFMIIPRYKKNQNLRKNEEIYFKNILGDSFEFLEPSVNFSTYKAIDISEVVVTSDSTLGYESVARGTKTAFFSIRSQIINTPGFSFGWPKKFQDEGLFWTNKPNQKSFYRILDYLFKVKNTQWKEDILRANFSSIMSNDPGNNVFKSIINKELGIEPYLK